MESWDQNSEDIQILHRKHVKMKKKISLLQITSLPQTHFEFGDYIIFFFQINVNISGSLQASHCCHNIVHAKDSSFFIYLMSIIKLYLDKMFLYTEKVLPVLDSVAIQTLGQLLKQC